MKVIIGRKRATTGQSRTRLRNSPPRDWISSRALSYSLTFSLNLSFSPSAAGRQKDWVSDFRPFWFGLVQVSQKGYVSHFSVPPARTYIAMSGFGFMWFTVNAIREELHPPQPKCDKVYQTISRTRHLFIFSIDQLLLLTWEDTIL